MAFLLLERLIGMDESQQGSFGGRVGTGFIGKLDDPLENRSRCDIGTVETFVVRGSSLSGGLAGLSKEFLSKIASAVARIVDNGEAQVTKHVLLIHAHVFWRKRSRVIYGVGSLVDLDIW